MRNYELVQTDWITGLGDDYEIECECGSDFYGELAFDKNKLEDENIVECSECYRRYKVTRTISIAPMEDNKELNHHSADFSSLKAMYHYRFLLIPACGHILEARNETIYTERGKDVITYARCLLDNCPFANSWTSVSWIRAEDGVSYLSPAIYKQEYKPWYWRHREEGWISPY